MLILDKGLFRVQPSNPNVIEYETRKPNALISYLHEIIDSLETFSLIPQQASIPLSEYGMLSSKMKEG